MKKKLIISLILLSISLSLHAQVGLGYRVGYGTYRMHSVAEFQQFVLDDSELPAQIVTQFPGYVNHRLYIGLPYRWPQYKAYLGYVTTGGRISLVDYSGKWNFDMTLNGFQAGLHWETPLKTVKKIDLKLYLDFGVTATILNMEEYIKVWEEESRQSWQFFAYGIDGEVGLEASYKLSFIDLGFYLGYEQDITTPFYLDGNYKAKLGTSQTNYTQPSWAGLRTGILVSYTFGKKE